MKRYTLLVVFLVLAVVTMACGFSVNLPVDEISAGETQTEEIAVPIPEDTPAEVKLDFGAGELSISPGAEEMLIEGRAKFNVDDVMATMYKTGAH